MKLSVNIDFNSTKWTRIEMETGEDQKHVLFVDRSGDQARNSGETDPNWRRSTQIGQRSGFPLLWLVGDGVRCARGDRGAWEGEGRGWDACLLTQADGGDVVGGRRRRPR